jgi:hypothetical protein
MADANIGGSLPVGDGNGLAAIASDLVSNPAQMHVMIAVIDTAKITRKTDTGEQVATVRVRRIEAVLPADLASAERLMRRALEHRTGQTTLPLELEDEISQVFADLELPDEGEPNGK